MFRSLIIAATLMSGAAFAHDAPDHPASGVFAPHVAGTTGGGGPEIHRPVPTSRDTVTAGVGTLRGGADDHTVSRTGPGRGTMGGDRAPVIVGNDGGQPVITR